LEDGEQKFSTAKVCEMPQKPLIFLHGFLISVRKSKRNAINSLTSPDLENPPKQAGRLATANHLSKCALQKLIPNDGYNMIFRAHRPVHAK
jgi:hypothetical protein